MKEKQVQVNGNVLLRTKCGATPSLAVHKLPKYRNSLTGKITFDPVEYEKKIKDILIQDPFYRNFIQNHISITILKRKCYVARSAVSEVVKTNDFVSKNMEKSCNKRYSYT